jgi:hypothetical protein
MGYALTNVLHEEETVLSKALKKAAECWDFSSKKLGEVVGLSEATVSRLKGGHYLLGRHSKQWELAVVFLRIFRGLDAYMGGDVENAKLWLKSHNAALGGVPLDLMSSVEGLTSVVQYIDYMRGQ